MFWPTIPKALSLKGVVLHTETKAHMAWRVPASLFAVIPKSWHVKDKFVWWYCNSNCKDSVDGKKVSPGGCSTRDGGIMSWKDDVSEDPKFRQCLLDSVQKQGGVWKKDSFCN